MEGGEVEYFTYKFSLMIYNYMDKFKSHAEFFSFLMRFFNEFCADLYAFSTWFLGNLKTCYCNTMVSIESNQRAKIHYTFS